MEKHIVVKVSGAREPLDVTIHPGTTAAEVLQALGLPASVLLTRDPAGQPFGADEVVFESLEEGAKVYAAPPMEVGK
ncbi:MAG: hypothetical protein PHV60_00745 [bacterium]|nr:hypothetical protein [bacterium]